MNIIPDPGLIDKTPTTPTPEMLAWWKKLQAGPTDTVNAVYAQCETLPPGNPAQERWERANGAYGKLQEANKYHQSILKNLHVAIPGTSEFSQLSDRALKSFSDYLAAAADFVSAVGLPLVSWGNEGKPPVRGG